jgi:phosphohistidine phosphatase
VAPLWTLTRATLCQIMTGPRRLYLLRHAKSSWDDPGLADHDRPLAPRGRRAAKAMAKHLRDERIEPALVLCSSAVRARETLERVDPAGEVRIEPELYAANADELLDRLRRVSSDVESVMLIGHNPAMQELARIEHKFPTGALATLTFDGDWSDLRPGAAELAAFVRPKQLD